MSVFCPKCGKITYNEYTCDNCQTKIKENNLPKQTKKLKMQNPFIAIPLIIIATALSYIAYNIYKEKQLEKKALKYITGTENPEELFELNSEERINKIVNQSSYGKDLKHITNQATKIAEKALHSYKPINIPIKIEKTITIPKQRKEEKKEKKKLKILITDQ